MGISIFSDELRCPIDPETLFGKRDARSLSNACQKVMHNWLYPYEGCYCSRPRLSEFCKTITIPILREYKEFLNRWYKNHPEEKNKEMASCKEWEKQHARQFRIIYGIAKRHNLYLVWCGPFQGDRWVIYRNQKIIAHIYC